MALGKFIIRLVRPSAPEKIENAPPPTEFWMLEPEAAYAHLEDMMALGEGLVSHVVQSVVKNPQET